MATGEGYGTVATPVTEAVTLTEVKNFLKVTTTADNSLITDLITAARTYAEDLQQRAYITRTFVEKFDAFPTIFRPLRSPFVAVTTIEYINTSGTEVELDSSYYTEDTASEPGRIYEAYGYSWPSVRDIRNCVTLTYTAGYGTASTDIPDKIRSALFLIIAHWYEHRETISEVTLKHVPLSAFDLLQQNRCWHVTGG